jgi:hypothetical protein
VILGGIFAPSIVEANPEQIETHLVGIVYDAYFAIWIEVPGNWYFNNSVTTIPSNIKHFDVKGPTRNGLEAEKFIRD